MGLIEGVLNYVPSPLYDTYTLAANTATPVPINFFGNTAGANGVKITNLAEAYKLSPPENFLVLAMRFVALGVDQSDLLNLFKNYTARLVISGKPQLDAPVEFWPGGAGLFGVTTETATKQFGNGVPDPRAIASLAAVDLKYAVKINTGETFKVELQGTTFTTLSTGAGLYLRCYLDGIYGRAVG